MSYELMLVATVGEVDSLLSRVEKLIKEREAVDLAIERLGKKQLAYPINKQQEAEYVIVNFNVSGDAIKPIWDSLRLEQEALLRHLLLKVKSKSIVKAKVEDDKTVSAKPVKKSPKVTVTVATKTKKAVKSPKVKRVAVKSKKAKSKKSKK